MERIFDVTTEHPRPPRSARKAGPPARIVDDIGHYTEERQSTVMKLEDDLHALSQREQELKERIEGLQKVPLPAAEYFARLVEKTEKKSATRDYVLFLLRVVVSGIVVVILKALGLG
jgi:hypothetical protein